MATIANTENNNDNNSETLMPQNIGLFRYVNEINDPCPTATLEYNDTTKIIDRFIGKQYVVCSIIFEHHVINKEGEIGTKNDPDPEKFTQGFLVNNIEIVHHFSSDHIHYRIHLISTMWMSLMKSVNYTTYGNPQKKNVIEILRSICQTNKIPIDDDSWSKCTSTSQFSYISGNNDNFFTCYQYLMNKSFFNQKNVMDGALKGIVYNDYLEKLCMFDFTKQFKYQGTVDINISKLMNQTFNIEGCDQVNLACVLNKTNVSKMQGLFPTILFNYNFQTNEMENESTDTRVIRAYCSGSSTKNESVIPMYDANRYMKNYSLWDNNMNIYNSSFSSIKDYNGLIVNVAGRMNVNPGWNAAVNISNAQGSGWQAYLSQEHIKKTQDDFKQLEGGWYVSKVVYLVNPIKKMFRQNLSLMRTENMVP